MTQTLQQTEQQPLFRIPAVSALRHFSMDSLHHLTSAILPVALNISMDLGFDQDLPLTLHQPQGLSGVKSSSLLSR